METLLFTVCNIVPYNEGKRAQLSVSQNLTKVGLKMGIISKENRERRLESGAYNRGCTQQKFKSTDMAKSNIRKKKVSPPNQQANFPAKFESENLRSAEVNSFYHLHSSPYHRQ
jgi:hypothetical protein